MLLSNGYNLTINRAVFKINDVAKFTLVTEM